MTAATISVFVTLRAGAVVLLCCCVVVLLPPVMLQQLIIRLQDRRLKSASKTSDDIISAELTGCVGKENTT